MSAVFLTGGTGFVGGALLGRLAAASEGRKIRALVRAGTEAVRAAGAEPVPGDVLDPESLRAGMAGCAVVYHVAGLNRMCMADPSPLFDVNVQGSLNVIDAAAASGVRRVIYTSSAAALGEEPETVGTEESPHRGWFLSNYERSKFEAEKIVFDAAGRHRIDIVSINPSSVQGPGRAAGSGRIMLAYLNGRLKVGVDVRVSLIDIDDCAEGHILAEEKGLDRERYVLSGTTLRASEIVALLDEITGLRSRMVWLPRRAASVAGAVGSLAQAMGRQPPICKEMARTLLHGHCYDGSKARRRLGLEYRPIRDTLRRAVNWYVDAGLISRRLPTYQGRMG